MGHPTPPVFAPPIACSRSAHIPWSVAAVPDVGTFSPTLKRVVLEPSASIWCCRMPSRHCVISRKEGREVGCICRREGFPIRSMAPQAPQPSKGSSLPLPLCRQVCLSCLAAPAGKGSRDEGLTLQQWKASWRKAAGQSIPTMVRKVVTSRPKSCARERRKSEVGCPGAPKGLEDEEWLDSPSLHWLHATEGCGPDSFQAGAEQGGTLQSFQVGARLGTLLTPGLTMVFEDGLLAETIPSQATAGTWHPCPKMLGSSCILC